MYPIEALKNTIEHMTEDGKVEYIRDTVDACELVIGVIHEQASKSKFVVGQVVYMNNGNLFIGVLKQLKSRGHVDVMWDKNDYNSGYNYTDIEVFSHSVLSNLLPVGSKVVMTGHFNGAQEYFEYGCITFGKANWVKIVGYDGIRVRVKLNDGSEFVSTADHFHLPSVKQENE